MNSQQVKALWVSILSILGVVLVVTNDNSSEVNIKNVVAATRIEEKISNLTPLQGDLIIVQAILESRLNGKPSQLATKYNNLYGIKCPSDAKHACVELKTKECGKKGCSIVTQSFAHFKTLAEGLSFRAKMYDMKRYQNLKNSKSFEEIAVLVQKDGYATDPNYSKLLISTYNKYKNIIK